ncbi:Replication initiator 1, partial [Ophiophagus hannah]
MSPGGPLGSLPNCPGCKLPTHPPQPICLFAVVSPEEVVAKNTEELQGPPERVKKSRIPHPSTPGKKPKRPLLQPGEKTPAAGEGEGVPESKAGPRTREKPYKCPKCRRSFLGRVALAAHRRLHIRKWRRLVPQAAGGSPYAPELAGPTLGDMGTGASPFPSSQGEGTLPFWPEMALHQQGPPAASFNPWALGYGPQPLPGHQAPGLPSNGEFICDQCGWSFHGWEELVTHQMAHMAAEGIAGSVPKAEALAHLATDRPYACAQCGKSFRHKPNLLAHRQVHTGERRYQCQECGKSFGSKAYLASHQHIHTGEKPYVCAQCGKSFRHKPNLISHQKIHTREPLAHGGPHPFETFNGEAFSSLQRPAPEPLGLDAFPPARPAVDALLPCARGTTPLPQLAGILPPPSPQPAVDRPFVCPVCAKQFRCKPYLVAHIRIHTGEKPGDCARDTQPDRFSNRIRQEEGLSFYRCAPSLGFSPSVPRFPQTRGHAKSTQKSLLPPRAVPDTLHVRQKKDPQPHSTMPWGLLRTEEELARGRRPLGRISLVFGEIYGVAGGKCSEHRTTELEGTSVVVLFTSGGAKWGLNAPPIGRIVCQRVLSRGARNGRCGLSPSLEALTFHRSPRAYRGLAFASIYGTSTPGKTEGSPGLSPKGPRRLPGGRAASFESPHTRKVGPPCSALALMISLFIEQVEFGPSEGGEKRLHRRLPIPKLHAGKAAR